MDDEPGPGPAPANGVTAANALTARWAALAASESSTALSGAGAWPLLALLAAGADDVVRAELEAALGLPAEPASAEAVRLIGAIDASDGTRAALGLWAAPDLPLLEAWLAGLPAGVARRFTGDAAGDRAALDAWVTERTDGLLHRMPVDVDGATPLVLASAIAMRTTWRQPFTDLPVTATAGPWAGRPAYAGLSRRAPGVAGVRVVGQALTLVTVEGDNDLDVVVALGTPDAAPGEVVAAAVRHATVPTAGLAGDALPLGDAGPGVTVGEQPAYSDEPVCSLRLPRFTVTASHDLLAHAGVFGLVTARQDQRHNFPGISPVPLFVDQARQDVTATFSARGFEAAAVTAFATKVGAAMPTARARVVDVVVDRPFAFVATHGPSGLVLVAGWVAEPEPWPAG